MGKFKMFLAFTRVSEWSSKTVYWSDVAREITHKSGMYFYNDTWAAVIRDSNNNDEIIQEGFWNFLMFSIPAAILEYRLEDQ